MLAVQNALWTNGLLRAAGALDTVIADYAIANNAVILDYDRDFAHVASVVPELQHQWIAVRGTV